MSLSARLPRSPLLRLVSIDGEPVRDEEAPLPEAVAVAIDYPLPEPLHVRDRWLWTAALLSLCLHLGLLSSFASWDDPAGMLRSAGEADVVWGEAIAVTVENTLPPSPPAATATTPHPETTAVQESKPPEPEVAEEPEAKPETETEPAKVAETAETAPVAEGNEDAVSVVTTEDDAAEAIPVPLRAPEKSESQAATHENSEPEKEARKPVRDTERKSAGVRDPKERKGERPSGSSGPAGRRAGTAARETGDGGRAAFASYAGRVAAHLQRYKRYPAAAQSAGMGGTVRLTFVLSRSGGLRSARISGSSGHRVLDSEVLAMVRRAQPFPPFPADLRRSTVTFTVPIRFSR